MVGNTKISWGRTDMTVDTDGKILVDEDVEKTDAQLLEENRFRETYNPEAKSVNFTRLRATDIKKKPREYRC